MNLYCCECIINNKKYIGITNKTIEERFRAHISESQTTTQKEYNLPFKRAIRKYGKENFKLFLLESGLTETEAKQKEIFYIKKFNTYIHNDNSMGYNATLGGEYNSHFKKEVYCLDRHTGCILEKFDSLKDASFKYGNGVRHNIENKTMTYKNRVWIYVKDYINNKDTNWFNYVHLKQKSVVQLKNGKLIKVWTSQKEASDNLNICSNGISQCCLGKQKTSGGFEWIRFKDWLKVGEFNV